MRTDNRILLKSDVKSKTGQNTRFYEIGWFQVDTENVISDKVGFETFCKSGCKNYGNNGGCPPFAPSFDVLRKTYRNMIVVWCRLPSTQLPKSYIAKNLNYFFAVSFVLKVLPTIMTHIWKHSDSLQYDFYLGESACKTCKVCAFKEDIPVEDKKSQIKCRNPKSRIFSLESTGIDTDLLMRQGGFPLYWYGRGKKIIDIPYSCKMISFLYKQDIPNIDLTQELVDILNKKKTYTAIKFDDLLS